MLLSALPLNCSAAELNYKTLINQNPSRTKSITLNELAALCYVKQKKLKISRIVHVSSFVRGIINLSVPKTNPFLSKLILTVIDEAAASAWNQTLL